MLLVCDRTAKELDLNQIELRLMRKYQWNSDRIDTAIAEYRAFLQKCQDEPGVRHEPSSADMDEVWHQHILHTEDYARDCECIFGYFLHHRPLLAGVCGDSQCTLASDQYCEAECSADSRPGLIPSHSSNGPCETECIGVARP